MFYFYTAMLALVETYLIIFWNVLQIEALYRFFIGNTVELKLSHLRFRMILSILFNW